MDGSHITTLVTFLVFALVIVFRFMRPQRMTASRLWIGPVVMILLTGFVALSTVEAHAPLGAVALAMAIGVVAGVPFGLLRGRHSIVRKTDNPKVLMVEPSIIPLLIWLAAFGLRFAIRAFVPNAGPGALAASDGFLAFAVASVIAARYVIAQKFQELHAV